MIAIHSMRAALTVMFVAQCGHAEEPVPEDPALPISIAELVPDPVPDEQNAAVYLEQIAADLHLFGRAHVRFSNTPDGVDFDERVDSGVAPTAEQLAAVRKILEDHSLIFEALEKAAACEAYASRLDFTLPPDQFIQQVLDRVQLRDLARGVHWKITLLLAYGKRDEAVRLGTQTLRLARLYENEPTLVNYLVSVAVRSIAIDGLNTAIRSGSIDPRVKAELLAELAEQNGPALQKTLRSERAIVLSNLNAHLEPARKLPQGIPPQLQLWQLSESNAIDDAVRSADRPWFEIKDEWDPAAFPQATIAPAIIAAFKAESRRLALVRCLQILIAAESYREHEGKELTELDQLELPAAAVVDPFSGKPLKLKSTSEGWLIYSVMENGIDDVGDFTDQKDYGLAPPGYQAKPAR